MKLRKWVKVVLGVVLFVGFVTFWTDRVEKINNGEVIVENHTGGY